jgi:REP element-mobilizing transposase RayT
MSYTTHWLHCVWRTKDNSIILSHDNRPEILTHFREYAKSKNIVLDYINLHKNHVHALINLGKEQSISKVMQLIKGESAYWINKQKYLRIHFSWQDDYYAVSVSPSHVERVRKYIANQDEHHNEKTWEEEVNLFLKKWRFEDGD